MGAILPDSELLVNQRVEPRVVFHRRAQLVLSCGTDLSVKTVDISASGIGIICPHPIQARQICSIKVNTVTPHIPDLHLKGSSAYCILSGIQGYRGGIQYTDVDPGIIDHIRRLVATAPGW